MRHRALQRFCIGLSDFPNRLDSISFSVKAAAIATLGWVVFSLVLGHIAPMYGILASGSLMMLYLLLLIFTIIRQLNTLLRFRVYDERALQAMAGVYLSLKPEKPLPFLRSAALSTDTCLEYIRLIKEIRLKLILELGGGSSSLIAGYQLKLNGEGRLIAIDHEKKWGEITEGNLLRHGLADVAEVRIAPLKAIELNGREYNWYDLKEFEDIVSIDILLIDGPPDTSDGGLRYPGLELLYRRLSHGGVILIDDCVMPRWNKQVLDWAKERGFEVESFYLNEKNTLLLRHNRHVSTWGDGGAGGLE